MNYYKKNKGKEIRKASKIIEKPKNCGIKPVTVRHTKTAFNLLKFITKSRKKTLKNCRKTKQF